MPVSNDISHLDFPGRDIPGADWARAAEYPELKPGELWAGADYLRLAWEIIRRSAKYRWHYHRLHRDGLLQQETFGRARPYLSSKKVIGIPGWEDIPAWQHYCAPDQLQGESLGQYVERNGEEGWLVVHGNWFAKRAWGVSEILSPSTPAHRIDLPNFFAPSRPHVTTATNEFGAADWLEAGMPEAITTYVSPREAVIRVRIDVPPADQRKLIEAALRATRQRLQIAKTDVRMRERMTKSSFWLRAWDAERTLGRRDHARLKRSFREQVEALPRNIAECNAGSKEKPKAFSLQAKIWAETQFDKVLGDADALISSKERGPFLSHCIGKGLAQLADEASFNELGDVA